MRGVVALRYVELIRFRTAVDGGNHGGAVTMLVGPSQGSSRLAVPVPLSDMKFDCKLSVSEICQCHLLNHFAALAPCSCAYCNGCLHVIPALQACLLGGSVRFINASYILFGVPLVSEFGSVLGLRLTV